MLPVNRINRNALTSVSSARCLTQSWESLHPAAPYEVRHRAGAAQPHPPDGPGRGVACQLRRQVDANRGGDGAGAGGVAVRGGGAAQHARGGAHGLDSALAGGTETVGRGRIASTGCRPARRRRRWNVTTCLSLSLTRAGAAPGVADAPWIRIQGASLRLSAGDRGARGDGVAGEGVSVVKRRRMGQRGSIRADPV